MSAVPTVTATQLKNETGSVLDRAARSPVKLTSHGRARVYLVPAETFERLIALEEAELARRAKRALKSGMLGSDASSVLLQGLLHAAGKPVSRRGKVAASHTPKAPATAGRKAAATRRRPKAR